MEQDSITTTFCNGQNWVTRIYSVVICVGKGEFTNGILKETVGATCDQPPPPFSPAKKC